MLIFGNSKKVSYEHVYYTSMLHWVELGLAVLTDCVEVVTLFFYLFVVFFCQVRGHIALGGAWVDCDHLCSHSGRQVVNFSSVSSSLMPLLVFWSQLSKIIDQYIFTQIHQEYFRTSIRKCEWLNEFSSFINLLTKLYFLPLSHIRIFDAIIQ